MDYDCRRPEQVIKALFSGENPFYLHTDGKLYMPRFCDKKIRLLDLSNVYVPPQFENDFFAHCGDTQDNLSRLFIEKDKPPKPEKKGGYKKRLFYTPENRRTKELYGFLTTIYTLRRIKSGDVAIKYIWTEMAKKRPMLLDKFRDMEELKGDYNKIKIGLKSSETRRNKGERK
jgi:hypothetical protein